MMEQDVHLLRLAFEGLAAQKPESQTVDRCPDDVAHRLGDNLSDFETDLQRVSLRGRPCNLTRGVMKGEAT
jgi:hypothetical protein